MRLQSLDIYALDANFEMVSVAIPYTNLQWIRRYYACGEFAMEVDISTYSDEWAYIGTPDRPELGMVQKVETQGEENSRVMVSGLFLEGILNDRVCFPRYKANAATAEQAVRSIFARYKDDLDIVLGEPNSPMLGNPTQSDFSDDELGNKLYAILERSELSLRCRYDYDARKIVFEVWSGLDRTSSQIANGFQTFSTQFGNISNKDILFDWSDYKNYAIVPINADDNGMEQDVIYIDWSGGEYQRQIVFDYRSSTPETDDNGTVINYKDFKDGIIEEASEKLMSYAVIQDINVDLTPNGGYLTDFDLGDKCDVILEDIGISMEARIVEITEVFKASGDGSSVTIGLGNKRVSNIRRLINRI